MLDPAKSVLTMAKEWADSRHVELMGGEDGYSPSGHTDPIEQCDHHNCRNVRASLESDARGWYCSCGWPNGLNLTVCARCGRSPGGPDNPCTIIYRFY